MKEHKQKFLQHVIEFPSFVSRYFYNKYGFGERLKTDIKYTGMLYEKKIIFEGELYIMMRLEKVCHYEHQNATPQSLWILKDGSTEKILQISTVGINLQEPSFDGIFVEGNFLRDEVNSMLRSMKVSPSMLEHEHAIVQST